MVLTFVVENGNGIRGILLAADNMIVRHYAAIFNTKDFCLGIEA